MYLELITCLETENCVKGKIFRGSFEFIYDIAADTINGH
jgi:hypothetical protein